MAFRQGDSIRCEASRSLNVHSCLKDRFSDIGSSSGRRISAGLDSGSSKQIGNELALLYQSEFIKQSAVDRGCQEREVIDILIIAKAVMRASVIDIIFLIILN